MTTPEQPTYTDIADAFAELADRIRTIDPDDLAPVNYIQLSILPSGYEAARVATVDAFATALLGQAGERQTLAGERQTLDRHIARGKVGPVSVSIHTNVVPPPPDEIQAELARLRAENEALRRELDDEGADR